MNSATFSFSIAIAMMPNLPVMVDRGIHDNYQTVEQPDESKDSRPVLETSGAADSLAEFT
jgi:hypothetical protein